MLTQTHNAQATLNFHGTSVTLIAHIPSQYPPNATSASYTIDDGELVTFPLKGLGSSTDTQFNSLVFTTPTLSNGPHTLKVIHGGDTDHTPLAFKSFYVTQTSVFPAVEPSPTSPGNIILPRRSNTGVIVGGVVGGLVLLALLAALCCWRQKRKGRDVEESATSPYTIDTVDGARPSGVFPATIASRQAYKRMASAASDVARGQQGLNPPPAPVVVRHKDSGVRLETASSSTAAPAIVELPPGYTLT
ncbi:hypothetical protein B0H17DRAFT_1076563 [Mycena rosella]|uniref:Uncharacterized protein n=1 Tax=Mycena rosella TaxID=1033263 RepID=A0AAD7D6Q1_MYCRO|nr:hypothetical protein B0H17DRAFT_1076563 [Mycena rosella]